MPRIHGNRNVDLTVSVDVDLVGRVAVVEMGRVSESLAGHSCFIQGGVRHLVWNWIQGGLNSGLSNGCCGDDALVGIDCTHFRIYDQRCACPEQCGWRNDCGEYTLCCLTFDAACGEDGLDG